MRSTEDIIRDLEESNCGLESLKSTELDKWLRQKHNELVMNNPAREADDIIPLEQSFLNLVKGEISNTDEAKIKIKTKLHNVLIDVQDEAPSDSQWSLQRVLTNLMSYCFVVLKPSEPPKSSGFDQFKDCVNERRWNSMGTGFLFFSKVPTHIVQLRNATSLEEMKTIAATALLTNPFFRHRDVKKLYEDIRDAENIDNLPASSRLS